MIKRVLFQDQAILCFVGLMICVLVLRGDSYAADVQHVYDNLGRLTLTQFTDGDTIYAMDYDADIDGYCCGLPGNAYGCSSQLPVDSDGDGLSVCFDDCPDDPAKTEPGDCGCGVADTDRDGDNTPDCIDQCPDDPLKSEPGQCGCGKLETDTDGDGTPDCKDGCPTDPNKIEPGLCDCNQVDTYNADGFPACNDLEEGDGECDPKSKQGNPIRIYNGNSIQQETDMTFPSPYTEGFSFGRHYNSRSSVTTPMGYGWRHTYHATLRPVTLNTSSGLKILDETGRGIYFIENGTLYEGVNRELSHIEVVSGQYVWHRSDDRIYIFDSDGRLVETRDVNGNRQLLSYNADSLLEIVTDEATGRTMTFHYDDNDNLTSVSYPDGK
ncbi:MAG: RHS repeat domain-containing protein [Desulfobacteraceae bacterium]|jgi:YD repeat-containing protein